MKNTKKLRSIVITIVFFVICLLAAWRSGHITSEAVWYSILPPLLAVTLALITHKLLISFAIGVISGGFFAIVPGDPGSLTAWGRGAITGPGYIWTALSDPINLQILTFVVLVLAMISVLIVSGGLQGIVNWLARYAKSDRSTQFVTALMGLAIFIDDYANTMIVGSSMRPMTDRYKISREKLAFLVDATSAPIAGLAVISTWIGYEVGLFTDVGKSLGIAKDGYAMFFDALSFRFYCIMMIIFVLVNVISGRDFGSMAKAEKRARKTGAIAADDAKPMTSKAFSQAKPDQAAILKARTAVIPIAALFICLLAFLWYDGGGMSRLGSIFNPYTWRDVIGSAENTYLILATVAGISLVLAVITATVYARISLNIIGKAILAGFKGSLLPMAILVLAWSLKGSCDDLQTGMFLIDAVGEALSPLWFPALLFIVAGLTSFATGTSWGTMAILIPIAIPLAFELDGGVYGLTTMISLGAVLDGAIFGDHCSPISDTTLMSSISSACDHIHHVNTQIPYSLTVGGLALGCGYIPAAFGLPSPVSILCSLVIIVGLFYLLKLRAVE